MIDLHCHILPNCDDGPKDLSTSLKLAQKEVNQGIDKALLTPHHMNNEYTNHKIDVINRVNHFQKLLDDNGIKLKVYPGQEVHLTGDLIKAIDNDDILFADKQHHYLMLELPSYDIPNYFNQFRFELNSRGITPVIVHPERNFAFCRNPDLLYQLVKEGCLTQVTSSSYLGDFGKKIQRFTNKMIDANLCFTFSSDAHGLNYRQITMQNSYNQLSKDKGSELSNKYQTNAYNILLGNNINTSHISKIYKDGKLKSFIRKIF